MTHIHSKFFSESDREKISLAVKEVERETSGEIVPYIVDRSDWYEVAEWRAGVICGMIPLATFGALRSFTAAWLPFGVFEISLVTMSAVILGALAAHFIPAVERLFAGADLMERRVRQRAGEAFLSEEVFATRDRTGVLIFLSLLEHRVVVLGDSGINSKVARAEWDGIVTLVVDAIKARKPADGLIAAIRRCGALLGQEGVARRKDDTDELSDNLRTGTTPKP
ncbi:MAG: hypothetical protein HW412_1855 [Bacteroidetes bacterium]|nr:hypothetical protein [Bacteroidota bacterium]